MFGEVRAWLRRREVSQNEGGEVVLKNGGDDSTWL